MNYEKLRKLMFNFNVSIQLFINITSVNFHYSNDSIFRSFIFKFIRFKIISNVNFHVQRWLKTQLIDNFLKFDFQTWKLIQKHAKIDEVKKHIEKMIEKINESNVLNEKHYDDVDETIKMKYLLNNERFYFEKSKL